MGTFVMVAFFSLAWLMMASGLDFPLSNLLAVVCLPSPFIVGFLAWRSARLRSTSTVHRIAYYTCLSFFALIAVYWTAAALSMIRSERPQTQRIDRVTEAQTLTFQTKPGETPSGYTLHVYGRIDGSAIVSASESSHSESIGGDVDWKIYQDYFRSSIDIQYSPTRVTRGHITVDLTFH